MDINRTTLANWSITFANQYLNPMYEYFHRKLLERDFLMADETPVQVLNEEDILDPAVYGVIYVDKLFSYERAYRERHKQK